MLLWNAALNGRCSYVSMTRSHVIWVLVVGMQNGWFTDDIYSYLKYFRRFSWWSCWKYLWFTWILSKIVIFVTFLYWLGFYWRSSILFNKKNVYFYVQKRVFNTKFSLFLRRILRFLIKHVKDFSIYLTTFYEWTLFQ